MRLSLRTLPYTTLGSPVQMAFMMVLAYSREGFTLNVLPALIALQLLMPVGQLLDAAFRVFIQRHFIASDKVIAARLDKPWRVFREMLRGLGDEVAQLLNIS